MSFPDEQDTNPQGDATYANDDRSAVHTGGAQPKKKKSGLWLMGLFVVFAAIVVYIGVSSDSAKKNSGPPKVKQSAEEFGTAVRQPRQFLPQQGDTFEAERPDATGTVATQASSSMPIANQIDEQREAQRRADAAAEELKRLKSPQVVFGGQKIMEQANGGAAGQGESERPGPAVAGLEGTAPPATSSGPNDRNSSWMDRAIRNSAPLVARASRPRDNEYRIVEGKVIDAVLETAINSDLPGDIRAIVSNDVYGSAGRTVLIPRMSHLVGKYNSVLVDGQTRVFVVWRRARLPNGSFVTLDSGGTDELGRSGLTGEVDFHWMRRVGTAALLSILGAGASSYGVSGADGNNSASQYRSDMQRAFSSQANDMLGSQTQIQPTVHVDQGTRIKVMVNRDVDFTEILDPTR